jgi:small subunit ribosomal protein S4
MSWTRKKKTYSRPKKPYDKARIDEEKDIVKRFGLKNKREIWKADSAIRRIRGLAKNLITAEPEEQNKLIEKLQKMGFKVEKIADALALTKENWLERRLQTVVFRKGIIKTAKGARQMITHRHIKVNKRIVNVPSYMVNVDEEDKVELEIKPRPIKEEVKKEMAQQ